MEHEEALKESLANIRHTIITHYSQYLPEGVIRASFEEDIDDYIKKVIDNERFTIANTILKSII